MGASIESVSPRPTSPRGTGTRHPLRLRLGDCTISVDADGAIGSLYSLSERRSLFGREQVVFSKVQAGVVVHSQRIDWTAKVSPRSAQLAGRAFDSVDVTQGIEFYRGESRGFLRRVRLRNGGQGTVKLRLMEVVDPTSAHFDLGRWGSLGVNAFNRESHVAMDEVSDPPSARVVGSSPAPTRFYMTTSRTRALEFLNAGELPDPTAGMSGQVLILSQLDIELSPGESREAVFVSIYNPGKLEEALSDFGRIQGGENPPQERRPQIVCSEQPITEAASWAVSAIEGSAFAEDPFDSYEALRGLSYFDPAAARGVLDAAKGEVRRDGSLPHSAHPSSPGILETAVFLRGAAWSLVLSQDKKVARSAYPMVKKLAGFLMGSSKDYSVPTDTKLPQGWRRLLGSGFPTGEIPEVSLAVAGALADASQVARLVSKSDDAARFRERSEMILDHVRKKLLDDRGFLALCRDTAGRLRADETVDMAVAAYRRPFMASAEQAAVHRLLEKDFDTPYGPRCVPNSNLVYFNGSYGQGQLGGVWPRAALAHALVCYRSGLSGMGSLALRKMARLVTEDAPRLGGSPGEFPLWVDVDRGEAHGEGGDPVAAARFVEALLEGELGMSAGAEKPVLAPPTSSGLSWLMASDVWLGEQTSAFLGRASGSVCLFYSGGKVDSREGTRFAKAERLDLDARGVHGMTFHSPGQVICLGNGSPSPAKLTVNFSPRAADLSKHLSTPLEAYDPSRGSWTKTGSIRVMPTMSFETTIGANDWRIFRVATA